MSESIGLYVFSGTGNTQLVAGLLEDEFIRLGADVHSERIEDVLKGEVEIDPLSHSHVGICHPILGFETPRIVYRFIDALPPAAAMPTFIVKTASDFVSLNKPASWTAIRRLRKKGHDVFYDRIVCMSPNWVTKYADIFTRQLWRAAADKARATCRDVLSGTRRELKSNFMLIALARLSGIGEDQMMARLFGRGLRATDDCINCHKCVRNCPTDTIRVEDGRIAFGWDCISCMRCIYACPQRAIVPRVFKFTVVKGGYDVRGVLDNTEIDGDFVTEETRGYYRHFLDYLRDPDL
ncbi:MAG: hypothetical protein E3J64_04245 [Anaerolineales bacterium]|nr:MAG: hypothetical protein E3J64_04245 [Anaerolineales bacterium]